MSISLVVADDHEVVRTGLRVWLADSPLRIVGEASNGVEALAQVELHRPDLVLLDVAMPKASGIDCLARLRDASNDVRVLMFSETDNPTYAARAAALGAKGLLLKSASRDELIDAAVRAAAGEAVWTGPMVRRLTGSMATPAPDEPFPAGLTGREVSVLSHLSFGLSNREIAEAMGISYETVKEHVQHILRKLGVADRTQAAVWAVRNGVA
ncbi:MAG: response regulator [Lacipirellulaceae bacterium]